MSIVADRTPDTDTKGSRSIRALEVLECIVASERAITIGDLSSRTGLPRASLHRIVNLLEDEGFLSSDLGGRAYAAGRRLRNLAWQTMGSSREHTVRHGILAALSREIGETCNISVPDGDAMVYVDRVETEWPLRHQLQVGARVPLHCTASGKLYLSSLRPKPLDRLLSVLPLKQHTPKTITDREKLEAALKEIRSKGSGHDNEEFIDSMVAVSAPITDAQGRMVAGLAFHAPTLRMTLEDARQYLPVLKRAAQALSDIIGSRA